MSISPQAGTTPLFVRLPSAEAEKLHQAAHDLKTSKRDLVTALVAEHLDRLRPGAPGGRPRRVVVETQDESVTVGHAGFMPVERLEVLTLEQAAETLMTTTDELAALAEAGDVPARRIGTEWRFSRQAVLDWLRGG